MEEDFGLVLGIDLGTTYFKAAVYGRDGRLQGLGRAEVPKVRDSEGACELPVRHFWQLVRTCIGEALSQADCRSERIKALAYSSQANSFLLLDQQGAALTDLILWPDLRAAGMLSDLRALTGQHDFLQVTGLGLETVELCVAKLLWYQQRSPEVWRELSRVQTISDFFVSELTGRNVSDEGTASLLGLWDLQSHAWWEKALQTIGLSRSNLSLPLPPGSGAGTINARGAAHSGLQAGTILAVGSLDHHVAAIGAGLRGLEEASISLGTVVACLGYRDSYRPLVNCCMGRGMNQLPYYQIAFEANGTGALNWYQRTHAPGLSLEHLALLARTVPPGSDGLLARPSAHNYPGLEGFCGLAETHGHGHFVRAVMESTAASLRELLCHLCPDLPLHRLIATGGGAKSNVWLQIISDLNGLEVCSPACEEPACRGAAMLAAVAAGWFRDLDGASQCWIQPAQKIAPDPIGHHAYQAWYEHHRAAMRQAGGKTT